MLLSWASPQGEALLRALVTGAGEQHMVHSSTTTEATPAPQSSNIRGEYKTCAEHLQKPALLPYTCIPLQFSNMKAGCANSVHNPDLALSNKHKNLPEQAGTDGRANNSFCQLPWSTSQHGQEPRFCNTQLPHPWLGLLLGWTISYCFPVGKIPLK